MSRPQVLVILTEAVMPPSLEAALRQVDAATTFWPLSEALRTNRALTGDVVVVVVPDEPQHLRGPLHVLFDRVAEQPRGTLVLSPSGQPIPPLPYPRALPVSCFTGADDHALAGQLRALVAMRPSLDVLHRERQLRGRQEARVARAFERQLRLASQLQRGFLPSSLPKFGPLTFSAVFRPVDFVSGDIYDVHRLDEEHVGIAVADATGHGMPAALLTVYIKRALRGTERTGGRRQVLPPDEVLARLNEDLLEADLAECSFVTAVYAIVNTRTRTVQFARGGAPLPLCRRADGTTEFCVSEGAVLGVLPDPAFEVQTLELEPGDSFLVYTDGVEQIVNPDTTGASGAAQSDALPQYGAVGAAQALTSPTSMNSATAVSTATAIGSGVALLTPEPADAHPMVAASPVAHSPWFELLARDGAAAAMIQLANRQRALRRMGYPLDDVTAVCLQVDAAPNE